MPDGAFGAGGGALVLGQGAYGGTAVDVLQAVGIAGPERVGLGVHVVAQAQGASGVSEAASAVEGVVVVAAIVELSTWMNLGVALLAVRIVKVVVALVVLPAMGVTQVAAVLIGTAVVKVVFAVESAVVGSVRRRVIRGAGAPETVPLRHQHGAEP